LPNTLPLPSGLWMGFGEDWVKMEISPNTYKIIPTKTLLPNKALKNIHESNKNLNK
jgi:hypothetical protein